MTATALWLAAALQAGVIGAATPPGWYEAMIRRDTARRIVADLPEAPRQFRFQCSVTRIEPKTFRSTAKRCIVADGQPVTDPTRFAELARGEAARPDVTAEDRLRRTAWLRAMLLSDRDRPPVETFETYLVDERVAASDLGGIPASTGEATQADFAFKPPMIDYPAAALRAGVQGGIELRCTVIAGGRIACETMTPWIPDTMVRTDGSLAAMDLLHLVRATHRASHAVQMPPQTRDGRVSEGLSFRFAVHYRLPD